MWKFFRGGATFIPGATSIPESRVHEVFVIDWFKSDKTVRVTPKLILNDEIKTGDWLKRHHMINFQASHWSIAMLVFVTTYSGVKGFVICWWDLLILGYSPYMTNLGDKNQDSWRGRSRALSNRDPYLTNTDKLQQLKLIKGFVSICQIWVPITEGPWSPTSQIIGIFVRVTP